MITTKDLTLQYVETIVQEVTTTCNLKCPTCRVTQAKLKPDFIGWSEYVQICNNIMPYLKKARVYNISSSESLLHPRWADMIKLVKSYNPEILISIITNGMLLNERNQDTLLRLGVRSICVSIDGARKETTEKIRVGSNFETVVENAKSFVNKGGLIRTIYTVRDNNIEDLPGFVDLADEIGIWFIKCTGLIAYTKDDMKHAVYSREGEPWADKIFEEAAKKAESKKIKFSHRPTKLVDGDGFCVLGNTMYIGVHGDISPCTYYSTPTPLTLFDRTEVTEPIIWGNVLEDSPQVIWLSDESLQFRHNLVNGLGCDTCGMKYVPACGRAFNGCEDD